MPDLSIIILSYNTKAVTKDCLNSLYKSLIQSKNTFEIIVIDNSSTDGSIEMLKDFSTKLFSKKITIKLIFNKSNKGFSKANNQGLRLAKGRDVLFLNSDIIIKRINWDKLLNFFNKNPKLGVLTVKVMLPTGKIDPASHRGFPNLWNSFCYFSGLEKLFGKLFLIGRLFSGYHLLNLNFNTVHEIDSPSGTFYLTKRHLLKKINGYDEDFFLYGEDVDLSFRIKLLGYKIVYYPYFSVLHLKSVSGFKKQDEKIRNKTREHFYSAMKIFYDKHYASKNSWLTNKLVYFLIDFKLKRK
jgi:GT2 family glycosyltransferase